MLKQNCLILTFIISCFAYMDNLENNACTDLLSYPFKDISSNCYYNSLVMAPAPQMILRNGYQVLTYYLTTPDGYDLQIFRIPPKEDDNRKNKQPVILEHGIFVDSGSWMITGNRSLAITLASKGYDVWLSNQRGTRYSKTHTSLSYVGYKYWLYSVDEVAAYDVSTFLDKVAEETGKAGSIIYIGHSRGTTLFFMHASSYPEKTEKLLKGAIALSPIVYFDFVWYLKPLVKTGPILGQLLLNLGFSALNKYAEITQKILHYFCIYFSPVCAILVFLSSGISRHVFAEDLLTIVSHSPTSIAVMQLIQYSQMANAKKFQKYDYGLKNIEKYGQPTPPVYELSKIKIPVFMFYGEHDILIQKKNVQQIYDELGSTKKGYTSVPSNNNKNKDQMGHNDFLWAGDLDIYFYEDLFEVMENELSV